ncbi:MAG TPA: hypothetical protein VFS94_09935, partial [Gemmatimonadales bacterium]|nr:hypothetical protein [Gemmatimonadales bacterium]
IAASLVACNESDPPAPDAPATETSAPDADAPQIEEESTPALTDESTVPLTMDNARAYLQALKNLGALGGGSVAMDAGETTAQYEARLASVPQVVAAIEDAGMSVNEFARFGEVFLAGVMAQSAIEAGQMQAPPAGLEAAVEFVEQNKAEIHALLASMEDAGG